MMLNPIEAQESAETRIREAHAFVAHEQLAQKLVAEKRPQEAGWKRRVGRWLIRLGQRWAPLGQTPKTPSDPTSACCPDSSTC